jgi:hypothetical protein
MSATSLFNDISSEMLLNLIPFFLANILGVRTAVIGLYGLYYAATEGAAKALVADLVPQVQRGTAYGLFNAVIRITVLPASLIAGVLWQGIGVWPGFGPSAPFFFGALMALLAGLLFARLVR